jgi:hypothetical protein
MATLGWHEETHMNQKSLHKEQVLIFFFCHHYWKKEGTSSS